MLTVLHRDAPENNHSVPQILGYYITDVIRNIISIDLTKIQASFLVDKNQFLGVCQNYYINTWGEGWGSLGTPKSARPLMLLFSVVFLFKIQYDIRKSRLEL